MQTQIKLLGLDLDGTLLDSRKRISAVTMQRLHDASDAGVSIVPVTGRPEHGIPADVLKLPGIQYSITTNGAVIRDIYTNKIISASYIPDPSVYQIVDILGSRKNQMEVFTGGIGYVSEVNYRALLNTYSGTSLELYMKQSRRPVYDISSFTAAAEKIEDIALDFKSAVPEDILARLIRIPGIQIIYSRSSYVEITAENATKGKALLHLADVLGIDHCNIMACGDDISDISMIQSAGVGVAMENACEEVKQAADFVTCSNDEDGIARAVSKFILCS
jgi:Cof subfamily protein (haloacid dehalogenase superfamily)